MVRPDPYTGPHRRGQAVALLTTFAAVMVLRIATVLVLVLYRRFRYLVVFLVTLVATDWVVVRLLFVKLPGPTVPVLVDVDGYAFPSKAIAFAITLSAMTFVLAPGGRPNHPRGVHGGPGAGGPGRALPAPTTLAIVYAAILAPVRPRPPVAGPRGGLPIPTRPVAAPPIWTSAAAGGRSSGPWPTRSAWR